MKKSIVTVTIKDCEVQTFTVGGNGGSGKDTANTGVRVIHRPSGASGKSTETRSQDKNKRVAFVRMAQTNQFRNWIRIESARKLSRKTIEEAVDEMMDPGNIKVEVRSEGGPWIVYRVNTEELS